MSIFDLGPMIQESVAEKERKVAALRETQAGALKLANTPTDFGEQGPGAAPSGLDAFLPLLLGAIASSTGGNPQFGQATLNNQLQAQQDETEGIKQQQQLEAADLLSRKKQVNDLMRQALDKQFEEAQHAEDHEKQLKILNMQKKLNEEAATLGFRRSVALEDIRNRHELEQIRQQGINQKSIAEIQAGRTSSGNKFLDMVIRTTGAESKLQEPFVEAASRQKMTLEQYMKKNPNTRKKLEEQISRIRQAEVAKPETTDTAQDYLDKLAYVYGDQPEKAKRLLKKYFPNEPFEVEVSPGAEQPNTPTGMTPLGAAGRAIGTLTPLGELGKQAKIPLELLRYLTTPLPMAPDTAGGRF